MRTKTKGMKVEKGTGYIFARVTFTDSNGHRWERKRMVGSASEVKKAKQDLLDEIAKETPQTLDKQKATFDQLAAFYEKRYLTEPRYVGDRKISGLRTYKMLQGQIKVLTAHFSKKPIRQVTHADLDDFRLSRLNTTISFIDGTARQRSITSVNRELALLRRIFKVAIQEGWVVRDPFASGKSLISAADETRRTRVLTYEEERRLLTVCAGEERAHIVLPILCALDGGMRKGEILSLRWNDLDSGKRCINILAFNTKTASARTVPVSGRLAEELLKAAAKDANRVAANEKVLSSGEFRTAWETAVRLAKLDDLHFHDLRSTFATRLIQKGLPVPEVSRLLGHSNLAMTFRYITPDTASMIERALTLIDA